MTDEQEEFLAEQRAVVRAQQLAREEQAEVRADQARLADAAARRDAAWDSARRTGRPIPTHDGVLARARDVLGAEDERDAAASYGSSTRPAVFVSMPDGGQVEVTARSPVARSASEAFDDRLLQEAKRSSGDGYMKTQIARFHARRAHQAEAERTVARRQLERKLGYGEISR
jgi:hypothetical protein